MTIVIEEAYRTIKVRDGDTNVPVSMATAITRALAVNAAKGNNRAALLFSTLLQNTERENRELHNQWLDSALTYKIEWGKELARRKRFGIVAEDPIPHPDDIVINARTGKVSVLGPMTREEKDLYDAAAEPRDDLAGGILEAEAELLRTSDPHERNLITAEVEDNRKLIDRIDQLIPSRKPLDWMK